MKSLEKVALALEIIPYLSQHNGISRKEAAEHFGITQQELYSILEVAVCCGLPGYFGGDLIDIDIWDDNLYVYQGMGLEQPLRLSRSEQAALTLALRALEQVPGFVSSSTVHSILGKLEKAKDKAETVTSPIEIANSAHNDLGKIISAACTERRRISFSYIDGRGEYDESRQVLPITVVLQNNHAYVVGWDSELRALRRFRFDRMSDVKCGTVWRGEYPVNSLQLRKFLDHAAAPHLAIVEIERDAVWLVDRLGLTNLVVSKNHLQGDLPYYTEEWLIRTALKFAKYLRIVHPTSAANLVEAHAEAALARYTSDT